MPTTRAGRSLWALLAALLPFTSVAAESLTIERIFAAPDLSGASLRGARFSPDGKLVTYLQGKATNKDRLDIWAYDTTRRENRLLVDSAALVPEEGALSPEEEARRERARTSSLSGIVEYDFSADSRRLLIPLNGDLYLYDLTVTADRAVRRLTETAAAETDARFSPRGRYVSFVRDQNLYVIDLTSGEERAITKGGAGVISFGMAEFIAQEEMDRSTGYWWSPDEAKIAYTRVDESPVDEVERFEIYAETVKVIRQRYPAAGRANAKVDLFVATFTSRGVEARELPAAAAGDGYLARVNWLPDSRSLAVQRQARNQQFLELLRIDIETGTAKRLLEERSDTWIDLYEELTFLKSRPAFIWASARSGYKHLYLYDLDGRLIRPLTSGNWMVVGDAGERAVEAVDEKRGLVYFTANRETPLERHLYSAPLDGSSDPIEVERRIQRVSTTPGWHSSVLSSNGQLWLDTYSNPDTPASLTLRRTDGRVIDVLVPNTLDESHPYAPFRAAHQRTEFGTLRAEDGQTLYYQLITPINFDPAKRYPVIVDVYGGPGNQRVRNAWGGFPRGNEGFFRQYLAQQGYVVFTLDNRGSGFRGTAFEGALYRRMGSIEIEDQVRGVEFLRSLPYVDARRVGVFGWSYGGYMALMAMVRAPDYFTAGVAGAPVTDWRLYDTHYTERFMSTPTDNPDGYRDGMVMTHAKQLRGRLLVMHGMADDNVLFTHSTALFKTLQDLRKPFEVMPYPGSKHALMRFPNTGPHGYDTVARFFARTLQENTSCRP
jgi:dipeptidyl-peptidase-4